MIDRNAFRASRSQRRVLGLVAASCLLSPAWLVAQRVWVVDKFQRAGFDAATIQAAVDAASSGDVIHVRFTTTSYLDRYAAPTIQGKGLTIAPEPGGARPTIVGQWNIQGVPNRLTIAGFDLIDVPEGEPWAANTLTIGDTVMTPSSFPKTRGLIEERGFKTLMVDISELLKAEAGLTCLCLIFESDD